MSLSDADGLSGIRRRTNQVLDRVASVLPTVRARLFTLVLVALVPALVILFYDQWLCEGTGLRSSHRSVDARRSPDAARDGGPRHPGRAPPGRPRHRSRRHRARSSGDAKARRRAARGSSLQQPVHRRQHAPANCARVPSLSIRRRTRRDCSRSSVRATPSTSPPGPSFPNRPPANRASTSRSQS